MRLYIALFWILLGPALQPTLWAQTERDTLLAKLEHGEAEPLDSAVTWLEDLASNFEIKDTILSLAERLIVRTAEADDLALEARTNKIISVYYGDVFTDDITYLDSALHYGQLAVEDYLSLGDTAGVASAYLYIADYLINYKRYAEAEYYIFRALDIAQSPVGEKEDIAVCQGLLAAIAIARQEYETAIVYARKVIANAPASTPQIKGFAYLDVGFAYYYQGRLDSAVYYAEIAREELNHLVAWGDSSLESFALELLVIAEYQRDPSPTAARAMYSFVDSLRAQYRIQDAKIFAFNLAMIDLEQRRYQSALTHLQTAESLCDSLTDYCEPIWHLERMYRLFIDAHSANGDDRKALEYQQKLTAVIEKRLRQDVSSQRAANAIQYETSRKDLLINEQRAELQQKERVSKVYSYAIIAAMMALLLFVVGVVQLVRQRRSLTITNSALSQQNARNKTLVQEIQHRVKNNLETIKSLLALQAASTTDAEARQRLLDSESRVQSMGLVHDQLYATNSDVDTVNLAPYCQELLLHVVNAYDASERVAVEVDVAIESLVADTAIPLGLLINELSTNAMKHAFPAETSGTIRLKIHPLPGEQLELLFEDDGGGLDASEPPSPDGGFGRNLIGMLVTQLNGEGSYYVAEGGGTGYRLHLTPQAPKH